MAILLREDFTTSALDTTDKWLTNLYVTQPSYSTWDASSYYMQVGLNGGTRSPIQTKNTYGPGTTFEWRGISGVTSVSEAWCGIGDLATWAAQFGDSWSLSGTNFYCNHTGNTNFQTNVAMSNTVFHTFKIVWRADGYLEYYIDDTLKWTSTSSRSGSAYFWGANLHDSGSTFKLDWVEIRNDSVTDTTKFFAMM